MRFCRQVDVQVQPSVGLAMNIRRASDNDLDVQATFEALSEGAIVGFCVMLEQP